MTWPTHRQYSITFAFIANMVLYKTGLTQINYYLALAILLLVSKHGALFPDVDHSWKNVKEKTVPNWIINKLIHITGGKHRSWQTHSIDITIISSIILFFLPKILFNYGIISDVNREVMSIILVGFCAGWISHIISDMLTSAGVRLICFLKIKVAFVPNHIFGFKFNTGHEWEEFCYKMARVINIALGIVCIVYPLILNRTFLELYNKIINLL